MASIDVKPDEPLERALRRFKRKVDKEEIIKEYRSRRYFKKPSKVKREKEIARRRKELKKIRKYEKRNAY